MKYVFALLTFLFCGAAQAQDALVVQSCGTLPLAYSAGATRQLTVDVNGKLCGSAASASGTFTAGTLVVGGPGSNQIQSAAAVFNGTSQFVFNSFAPNVGSDLALGTSGVPITTSGPNLKLSRTENISAATCGGNQVANECNATLVLISKAAATDGMQVSALFAGAVGASTTAGTDAVGASMTGRMTGSGVGIGTGAYFEGRADTSTGKFLGAEFRANNQTGSSYTYSTSGFSSGALWLTAQASSGFAGHGVALGSISAAQFDVGYAAVAGSVATTTFQDDSSSTTSIRINGSHTNQIVGTGFSFDGSGNASSLTYSFSSTVGTCTGNTMQLGAANTIWFCTNGNHIGTVTTFGISANSFTVSASNNPANGMNLVSASSVGFYTNSIEAFHITSSQQIQYDAVATGTPAASLCIDASNNIIKKTTTGSCI